MSTYPNLASCEERIRLLTEERDKYKKALLRIAQWSELFSVIGSQGTSRIRQIVRAALEETL